MKVKDN